MYRDTCHYISVSAQDLRATLSPWGIWRKQNFVGDLGWSKCTDEVYMEFSLHQKVIPHLSLYFVDHLNPKLKPTHLHPCRLGPINLPAQQLTPQVAYHQLYHKLNW